MTPPIAFIFPLIVALLLGTAVVAAQDVDSEVAPESATATESVSALIASAVTVAVLESRVKEVESSTETGEADKAKLIELYRKALSSLESVRAYDAKAAVYAQSLETAASEVQRIGERIKQLEGQVGEEPPRLTDAVALSDIEQQLAKAGRCGGR